MNKYLKIYTPPLALLAAFAAIVWFSASPKGTSPVAAATPHEAAVMVSSDAVNYMHDWDVQYTLTDLRSNQAIGGGIVGLLEGPGGKGCCVSLPAQWQPGIKLRVDWQLGGKDFIKPDKYSRTIELPRYTQPGDVYVLFYPNDDVEIVASPVEPGHAGWQGRIKAGAWNACVARLSEKECKKNLPKYAPGSQEANVAGYRASCQPDQIKTKNDPAYSGKWTQDDCAEFRKLCLEKIEIDKRMCEINFQEE